MEEARQFLVRRSGGCYIVPKHEDISSQEIDEHRSRLTVAPVKPPGWGAPPCFEIYTETNEALLVPRYYAREYMPQHCQEEDTADDDRTTLRELPFVGELTDMQQDATKK